MSTSPADWADVEDDTSELIALQAKIIGRLYTIAAQSAVVDEETERLMRNTVQTEN